MNYNKKGGAICESTWSVLKFEKGKGKVVEVEGFLDHNIAEYLMEEDHMMITGIDNGMVRYRLR